MLLGGKTISGKINLDGESILDLSEQEFDKRFRWKKISMVFQGAMNSLDPVFTIKKQFVEVLKQHKFEGDFENVIADAINSVSLTEDVLKKYPHELSGGMKQRIIIAMALLLKPTFVLFLIQKHVSRLQSIRIPRIEYNFSDIVYSSENS